MKNNNLGVYLMRKTGNILCVLLLCLQITACRTMVNRSYQLSKPISGNMLHQGYTRNYSVYIPKAYNQNNKIPLVLALHGGGGSAKKWPGYTNYGFEKIAERAPYVLVYPDGLDGQWNDGRDVSRSFAHKYKVDDIGFLSALIDKLLVNYSIDPQRVYVLGVSNGGMMAHYLAGKHAGKITAIASVIASIPQKLEAKLIPEQPVSVLMINGTEDALVRWEGGLIQLGKHKSGYVISVEETVDFWVTHNQCQSRPEILTLPDRVQEDKTRVIVRRYAGGKLSSDVELYTIQGGGHTWPAYKDMRGPLLKWIVDPFIGRKSLEIDTCEVIWDFFSRHSKPDK